MENEVSRATMKAEALRRMKELKLHPNVIKEFDKEDKLNCSDPPYAALFWLDDEVKEQVKKFEKTFDYVVYHVIKSHTEFGTLYDMLFVSKYTEEWKYDRVDMTNGLIMSYCYNADGGFGEIGSICIKPLFGGLIRIG